MKTKLQHYILVDIVTYISKLNDEQNKLNKIRIKRVEVGYKFCDSSRLFILWGSNAPAKLSDRCFCWLPAAMLVPISMQPASPYKSL